MHIITRCLCPKNNITLSPKEQGTSHSPALQMAPIYYMQKHTNMHISQIVTSGCPHHLNMIQHLHRANCCPRHLFLVAKFHHQGTISPPDPAASKLKVSASEWPLVLWVVLLPQRQTLLQIMRSVSATDPLRAENKTNSKYKNRTQENKI